MVTDQMRQFNEELIEEVREYRENEKCSTEDAFTSVFSSYVIDAGETFLNNCNVLSYRKEYEKAKINAYVYDEYFQTLTLAISVFENRIDISKMGKVDINKNVKQATKFYRMCKSGYFNEVEETDLINGSNELVKKYVEAIEKIKPKAFVMENVKTIASNKQSFCVTHTDEKHIKNDLKLNIYSKEVTLFDGEHAKKVFELARQYDKNIDHLLLISEDDLYFLHNMCKKKKQIEQILSKQANLKLLNSIADKLVEKENLPQWYNEYTSKTRKIIDLLLENKKIENTNYYIDEIMKFWDIHRFYHGIAELKKKDAIFKYEVVGRTIRVKMETYIVIDFIKESFRYLGYKFKGDVLNAAAYGVPQTRERYILIGIKETLFKEEIELPKPIIDNPINYITVKEAIKDLEEIEPTKGGMDETQKRKNCPIIDSYFQKLVMVENYKDVHNHVCTATRETAQQRFEQIGQGENFHSLPDELKSSYENPERTQNTVYKRLDPNSPFVSRPNFAKCSSAVSIFSAYKNKLLTAL